MRPLVRLIAAIAMIGSTFAVSAAGATADQPSPSQSRGTGPAPTATCPSNADPQIDGGLAHWKWVCVGKHSMRLTGYVQDTRRDGWDVCISINAGNGRTVVARTNGAHTRAAINPPVTVNHRSVATYLEYC